MDSLHLIRAASEFADVLERDAQTASAAQLARTEEEVRRRQRELQAAEVELERKRAENEREASELLTSAKADATEMREAGVVKTRDIDICAARIPDSVIPTRPQPRDSFLQPFPLKLEERRFA